MDINKDYESYIDSIACYTEMSKQSEKSAKQAFRTVKILIFGGLLAILFLPYLVKYFDLLDRSFNKNEEVSAEIFKRIEKIRMNIESEVNSIPDFAIKTIYQVKSFSDKPVKGSSDIFVSGNMYARLKKYDNQSRTYVFFNTPSSKIWQTSKEKQGIDLREKNVYLGEINIENSINDFALQDNKLWAVGSSSLLIYCEFSQYLEEVKPIEYENNDLGSPDSKINKFKECSENENWKSVKFSSSENKNIDFNQIDFKNGYGVIVGDKGKIFETKDSGSTWNSLTTQKAFNIYAVAVTSENKFIFADDFTNDFYYYNGESFNLIFSTDSDIPAQAAIIRTQSSDIHIFQASSALVDGYTSFYIAKNLTEIKNSNDFEAIVDSLKGTNLNEISETINELLLRIKDLESDFENLEIDRIKNEQLSDQDFKIEKYVVRASVLGVILFLTQIVINNYRYHTQLSTFYYSRAVALRIISSNSDCDFEKDIESFMRALTPPTEFGKISNNPVDSVINVANNLNKK